MHPVQDPFLQLGVEIDQKVAQRHEVDVDERRVLNHIVQRKQDDGPEFRAHGDAAIADHEVFVVVHLWHIVQCRLRIFTQPCPFECGFVDVGGKDLDPFLADLVEAAQSLGRHHGNRIGFFSGGAAGHPKPQRTAVFAFDKRANCPLKAFEFLGIAKKPRDRDQEILEQGVDLCRRGATVADIFFIVIDTERHHAPLDPALNGAFLVFAEIDPSSGQKDLQKVGNLRRVFVDPREGFEIAGLGKDLRQMLANLRRR